LNRPHHKLSGKRLDGGELNQAMHTRRSYIWRIALVPLAAVISLGLQAEKSGSQDPHHSVDERLITLPSGSVIPVRLADEVNSSHDKAGELYSGTVDPSVLIQDHVVIPRGTEAHIRAVEIKKGGHLHGKAKVRLELVSLIINGKRLGIETNQPSKKEGTAHAKASAEAKKSPEGAGVMVGNPGAVAGPVIAAFSAAKVDVKPGSRIEFTLEAPFTFQRPLEPEQRELQHEVPTN
jgi:hypothetical protein